MKKQHKNRVKNLGEKGQKNNKFWQNKRNFLLSNYLHKVDTNIIFVYNK